MNRNEQDQKTTAELLTLAKAKAASLEKERMARPGNDHPDHRVPGEIVEVLAFIGRRKRDLVNIIQRNLEAIERHKADLAEIDTVASDLRFELGIATGLDALLPNLPPAEPEPEQA